MRWHTFWLSHLIHLIVVLLLNGLGTILIFWIYHAAVWLKDLLVMSSESLLLDELFGVMNKFRVQIIVHIASHLSLTLVVNRIIVLLILVI